MRPIEGFLVNLFRNDGLIMTASIKIRPSKNYLCLKSGSFFQCYAYFPQSSYSSRIEDLINSREAISGKWQGFMINFFITKSTYRCTILHKVLEPFQWIHFFFCKSFFSSFLHSFATKITPKKIPLKFMSMRQIYTNFLFCWRFSDYFCGYGTQNTKSGTSPYVFHKNFFLVWK